MEVDSLWKQKYFELSDKIINPPIMLKRDIRNLRYVRLGHWNIEIIFAKNPKHDSGDDVWGMWSSRYKTITLDEGIQDDIFLMEILWHELAHAILEYFDADPDSNESVCVAFGRGMALLIKDNPELMETLYDC